MILWLFESQFLFCKRAETVGVNAINALNLKRVWLVAMATILSETFKMYFLFKSAILILLLLLFRFTVTITVTVTDPYCYCCCYRLLFLLMLFIR